MILPETRNRVLACVALAALAVAFCAPVFRQWNYWGQNSWDQFLLWNGVARETLVRYHQIPLWDPYEAGGNVMLAHPHSSFLSPSFLAVLAFGELHGLKILIPVYFFVGMLGSFVLCRGLRLATPASFLAAAVFMMGSYLPLHVAEGHPSYLVMALLPWCVHFFLRSFARAGRLLGAVVCLGLMFLGGSVYVFLISGVFLACLALLLAVQSWSLLPLKRLAAIGVFLAMLCAVKLVPLAEYFALNPRAVASHDGAGAGTLYRMVFDRDQAGLDMLDMAARRAFGVEYHWHEYGAYLGWVPLALALLAGVWRVRRLWPWLAILALFLVVAMGNKAPVDLHGMLVARLPVFRSLRVPSRFMVIVVFVISMLAAWGLDGIFRSVGTRLVRCLLVVVVAATAADLYLVSSPVLRNAFVVPPVRVVPRSSFTMVRKTYDYCPPNGGDWVPPYGPVYPSYHAFLSNVGVLDSDSPVYLKKGKLRTADWVPLRALARDPDRLPGNLAFVPDGGGTVDSVAFTPNRIAVSCTLARSGRVVLNQNWFTGWRVRAAAGARLEPFEGLVSATLPAGRHDVEFYYSPASFWVGTAVSLCFVPTVFLVTRRRRAGGRR